MKLVLNLMLGVAFLMVVASVYFVFPKFTHKNVERSKYAYADIELKRKMSVESESILISDDDNVILYMYGSAMIKQGKPWMQIYAGNRVIDINCAAAVRFDRVVRCPKLGRIRVHAR